MATTCEIYKKKSTCAEIGHITRRGQTQVNAEAVLYLILYTRFSLSVDNEQADPGMRRPNPSRETKFSGPNGDRGIFTFSVQLTTSRWQPYPVDPYSALCDG